MIDWCVKADLSLQARNETVGGCEHTVRQARRVAREHAERILAEHGSKAVIHGRVRMRLLGITICVWNLHQHQDHTHAPVIWYWTGC